MRSVIRASIALLLALLVLTAAAPAAGAQAEDERDNIVVLTGRAEVREDETVDNVIIFDGPVSRRGHRARCARRLQRRRPRQGHRP